MRNDDRILTRRQIVGAGAGTLMLSLLPVSASATPEDVVEAQRRLFGDQPMREGRVTLKLPPIAENGYSVPLSVSVESPMTAEDHVKKIAIFAERNPLADIVQFNLTPACGRADVSTRIRMGGSQTITAVAKMSDGELWVGTAKTVVTLAACVVM